MIAAALVILAAAVFYLGVRMPTDPAAIVAKINALAADRDALRTERDALKAQVAAVTAERDDLKSKFAVDEDALSQVDAALDVAVPTVIEGAGATGGEANVADSTSGAATTVTA
jgi:hypothetical protein